MSLFVYVCINYVRCEYVILVIIYIYIYIYMYICTCICICIGVYIYIYIYIYVSITVTSITIGYAAVWRDLRDAHVRKGAHLELLVPLFIAVLFPVHTTTCMCMYTHIDIHNTCMCIYIYI